MTTYYVYQHQYGRKRITRGPCAGLLEWPQHKWTWISKHRSQAKAIDAAMAHDIHARVSIDDTSETCFDNGKAAGIPEGWYPPDAQRS